eukprot:evm.model.scf_130EXC.9 EVM.evm.TU.scf_130EXC.9   scf_130EXC:118078-119436(-)
MDWFLSAIKRQGGPGWVVRVQMESPQRSPAQNGPSMALEENVECAGKVDVGQQLKMQGVRQIEDITDPQHGEPCASWLVLCPYSGNLPLDVHVCQIARSSLHTTHTADLPSVQWAVGVEGSLQRTLDYATDLFMSDPCQPKECVTLCEGSLKAALAAGMHPFHHVSLSAAACLSSACHVCACQSNNLSDGWMWRSTLYAIVSAAGADTLLESGESGLIAHAARCWGSLARLACELLSDEFHRLGGIIDARGLPGAEICPRESQSVAMESVPVSCNCEGMPRSTKGFSGVKTHTGGLAEDGGSSPPDLHCLPNRTTHYYCALVNLYQSLLVLLQPTMEVPSLLPSSLTLEGSGRGHLHPNMDAATRHLWRQLKPVLGALPDQYGSDCDGNLLLTLAHSTAAFLARAQDLMQVAFGEGHPVAEGNAFMPLRCGVPYSLGTGIVQAAAMMRDSSI